MAATAAAMRADASYRFAGRHGASSPCPVAKQTLIKALAAYEQDMIGYGFAAVQASLKNMERFHATGILARSATKALFRVIDYLPPLKGAFLGR